MSQSSSPEQEIHALELSLLRPEARDSGKAAQLLAAESLRSSVWVRRDGRWQMVFHQGTLCPGSR